MTDGALQLLFSELLTSIVRKQKYKVTAVFYETKSIRHTIEMKRNHIKIRIAQSFRDAPEYILKNLGIILFSKLFHYKIDSKIRREYKQYVEDAVLPFHPPRRRKPSSRYKSQGKFYNLNDIFDDVNRVYFQSKLPKPKLGWSLNKSYTRLGFYAEDKHLLVISRIFDNARVPIKIVEYMMYHEMLHIAIPSKIKNGRRSMHPRELRQLDHAFPDYDKIQKWIKKYRTKL